MATYTVIWRGNHDDFMFTEVDLDEDVAKNASGLEWVLEAAEVEYSDWNELERIAVKAELFDSYELLDVIEGKLKSVL